MINDFIRGDTKKYKISLTYKGTPLALYGSKIYFTMKLNQKDSDDQAAIQKIVTPPDNDESAAGTMLLTLNSEDTTVTPETYFYDIQQSVPSNIPNDPPIVTTLISGKVKVLYDITQTS